MTRECSACGLRSCDGVACYLEDRPASAESFNELCERILRERKLTDNMFGTETVGDPLLRKRA